VGRVHGQKGEARVSLSASTLSLFDDYENIRLARTDFLAYIENVLTDKNGEALPVDPYTRLYADWLEKCFTCNRHSNHVAPTGCGKTTIARGYLTMKLGQTPTTCAVISGAGDKVSQNSVTLCREMVLSQRFRAIFPGAIPDFERSMREGARGWKKDEFFFKTNGQQQDPALAAVPAKPLAEGRRVDIGLFDDFITLGVIALTNGSKTYRDRFFSTWLEGRMKNAGWAMLIHNCLRLDDLPHELRSDPRVASLWFGVSLDCERAFARIWNPPDRLAIIDAPERFDAFPIKPNDGATFEFEMPLPQRSGWSPDEIRAMTPEVRRRNMHLIPMSPDDLMFPAWATRTRRDQTAAELLGVAEAGDQLPQFDQMANTRYMTAVGIDISSTSRPGFPIVVWARDGAGRLYKVMVRCGKFTTEECCEVLDLIWDHGIRPSAIVVESNAIQSQVMNDMKTIARLKNGRPWIGLIIPFTTGANKSNPELGLPGINTMISNDAMWFPEAEATRNTPWAKDWRMGFDAYATCPRFLRPGQTPDIVMADWFAVSWLMRGMALHGSETAKSRSSRVSMGALDRF
jgi:hypothetical protein